MCKMILVVMSSLLLFSSVMAQLDTSMIMVRKSELPINLIHKIETEQKMESIGKFAGVGREVGVAIREGLGALTDETNKLANTKVGHFIMFIIAFKVIGYPFMQFCVGVPILFIGTIIFLWYFNNSCLRKRVLDTVTGEGKDKVKQYKIQEPKEDWLPFATAVVYVEFVLICMWIILIH